MTEERTLTDEEIKTRADKRAKAKATGPSDEGWKGDVPQEKPDYKDSGSSGAENDLIVDADGHRDSEDQS